MPYEQCCKTPNFVRSKQVENSQHIETRTLESGATSIEHSSVVVLASNLSLAFARPASSKRYLGVRSNKASACYSWAKHRTKETYRLGNVNHPHDLRIVGKHFSSLPPHLVPNTTRLKCPLSWVDESLVFAVSTCDMPIRVDDEERNEAEVGNKVGKEVVGRTSARTRGFSCRRLGLLLLSPEQRERETRAERRGSEERDGRERGESFEVRGPAREDEAIVRRFPKIQEEQEQPKVQGNRQRSQRHGVETEISDPTCSMREERRSEYRAF